MLLREIILTDCDKMYQTFQTKHPEALQAMISFAKKDISLTRFEDMLSVKTGRTFVFFTEAGRVVRSVYQYLLNNKTLLYGTA